MEVNINTPTATERGFLLIDWAFSQPIKSATQKLVLVALAHDADDYGICSPSLAGIAIKTSLNRKSVIRAVKELKHEGYIELQSRQTDRGDWLSNVYKLSVCEGN